MSLGNKENKKKKTIVPGDSYRAYKIVWKILSDGKWLMVSNKHGILEWWVMNDEWQKLSDQTTS